MLFALAISMIRFCGTFVAFSIDVMEKCSCSMLVMISFSFFLLKVLLESDGVLFHVVYLFCIHRRLLQGDVIRLGNFEDSVVWNLCQFFNARYGTMLL